MSDDDIQTPEMKLEGKKLDDSDDEGDGDAVGIWKLTTHRTDESEFNYDKKIITVGSGWKKPKHEEKTYVNISVHDTEDSPALATRDGYNFIIHEEIGVDVLSPFGTPALSQLHELFPQVKDNKEFILRIALVSWQAVEYVGDDKAVKLVLIKDGDDTWKTPVDGSRVTVHGQTFINVTGYSWTISDDNLPAWLCPGLDTGVTKIKRHETTEVHVMPPEGNGYIPRGKDGVLVDVPADAVLVYTVTVQDFTESYEMSFEERVNAAISYKDRGNKFFKDNNIRMALKRYVEHLVGTDKASEQEKKIIESGRASAHYYKAIEHCDKALKNDPGHVKAKYRKAQALLGIAEFRDAIELLKKDPAIDATMAEARKMEKAHDDQTKQMFSKMFA